MSSNFPVDDDGNWLSLPTEPLVDSKVYKKSERRMWMKSNPVVLSFIEQVKDIAPLRYSRQT